MSVLYSALLGIIPYVFGILGAFSVFFIKNSVNKSIVSFMMGMSSGIMLASAIWSLFLPSLERLKINSVSVVLSVLLFVAGGIAVILLMNLIDRRAGEKAETSRLAKMITLNNLLEGIAIGASISLCISCSQPLFFSVALCIGIGVQNIPETSALSMYIFRKNKNKRKAFAVAQLTGMVEPVAAAAGAIVFKYLNSGFTYITMLSSGAMLSIVCAEIIPDTFCDSRKMTAMLGTLIGFAVICLFEII